MFDYDMILVPKKHDTRLSWQVGYWLMFTSKIAFLHQKMQFSKNLSSIVTSP